jgi:chromosome segregation ATPase
VGRDLETILGDIGSHDPVELSELETAYTSGCGEVLELEAELMRTRRRLNELREQLRHVRTAIEWLQEERLQEERGVPRASQ